MEEGGDHAQKSKTPQPEITRDHVNLCLSIQKRLRSVFDDQASNAHMQLGSSLSLSDFKDAQYVMAALADEIFLNLKWGGAGLWKEPMLETQLFSTHVAGEMFFKKLDALLTSFSAATLPLAMIYLLALSFGFRGQYRGRQDESKISWYKDQLYTLVNGGAPNRIREPHNKFMESCYDFTITEPPLRGLPDVKTWTYWIGGVLLAYVFVTYIIWYGLSSEIYESLNLIFETAKNQPLV